MGSVASSAARLAGAALVLLLSAASGAPEDTTPLMVMRMQDWGPRLLNPASAAAGYRACRHRI